MVFILLVIVVTIVLMVEPGAAEVLDNFECKVPGMNRENGCDQYIEGTLCDEATGEIYVVFQNRRPYHRDWANDSIVCAHLDPDTGTLTTRWVYPHKVEGPMTEYYFPRNRQYLVHDGHFYFLYYSMEDNNIHLRIDDMTVDVKVWFSGEFQLHILCIRDGSLLFLVDNWERDAVGLYAVSLEDLTSTTKDIFTYDFDVVGKRFRYRNGAVHAIFWRQTKQSGYVYSYDLWVERYYVGLELRVGPTLVGLDPLDYYGSTRFDVDSSGNFHIMCGDYYGTDNKLHNVTIDGDVVASIDIDGLMVDIDVNFTEPRLEVLVNRTDHVMLVGTFTPNHYENIVLCSFTVSPTYQRTIPRHIIQSGPSYIDSRFDRAVMNGTGDIFVTWSSMVDDLYRVMFTHQIPPTPDLEVRPSGFRYREVRGATDPVRISLLICNVGRAASISHRVEVSYSLDGGEPFIIVSDLLMEVTMRPGDNYTFESSMSLPQGNVRFRLRVHDVVPYENNKLNNILERWLYVSNNNPPTILVELPEDGSIIQDTMTIKGVTDDLDVGGVLNTSMTGLPTVPVSIEGRGPWLRTLDLSEVPSGVYILGFQAYDGDFFSGVVYRKVRVARAEDVLRVVSLHPQGDVTLLRGQRFMFHYNATDPLTSVLDYKWALESGEWVDGGSGFLFEAGEVGTYHLRVEVSNGFTTLSHSWNVTVIDLIEPSIGEVEPKGPLVTLRKRQEMGFAIGVSNPHTQPFILKWTLDGDVLSGTEDETTTISFDTSGHHALMVMLFAASSQDSFTWDIEVTNEAPEIVSWTPLNLTQTILDRRTLVFEVVAMDADNDVLQYVWSLDGQVLDGADRDSCQIDLPFVNMTDYLVVVSVGDGEENTDHRWTVKPQATDGPDDPLEPQDGGGRWRTASIGFLVLVVVVVVAVLSFFYVRWKGV